MIVQGGRLARSCLGAAYSQWLLHCGRGGSPTVREGVAFIELVITIESESFIALT